MISKFEQVHLQERRTRHFDLMSLCYYMEQRPRPYKNKKKTLNYLNAIKMDFWRRSEMRSRLENYKNHGSRRNYNGCN